jgi:hypothetical protein
MPIHLNKFLISAPGEEVEAFIGSKKLASGCGKG